MTSSGQAARVHCQGRAWWILACVAVVVALVAGAAIADIAVAPAVSGPSMIGVRDEADALAVAPDGRTLFVANCGDDT